MRIPKFILLLFALSIATGVSFAADVGQPEKERPLTEIVSQCNLGSQVDVIEIVRNDIDNFVFVLVDAPVAFAVTNCEIVEFKAVEISSDAHANLLKRPHKYRWRNEQTCLKIPHEYCYLGDSYTGERIFAFS
jgi:hypothetical protein